MKESSTDTFLDLLLENTGHRYRRLDGRTHHNLNPTCVNCRYPWNVWRLTCPTGAYFKTGRGKNGTGDRREALTGKRVQYQITGSKHMEPRILPINYRYDDSRIHLLNQERLRVFENGDIVLGHL